MTIKNKSGDYEKKTQYEGNVSTTKEQVSTLMPMMCLKGAGSNFTCT